MIQNYIDNEKALGSGLSFGRNVRIFIFLFIIIFNQDEDDTTAGLDFWCFNFSRVINSVSC